MAVGSEQVLSLETALPASMGSLLAVSMTALEVLKSLNNLSSFCSVTLFFCEFEAVSTVLW